METPTWEDLKRDGYECVDELVAALPMRVWVLDLEVERRRPVSAAELAVLNLVADGRTEVPTLSTEMGLGEDHRLVDRTLVKLLRAGAVETKNAGFALTKNGEDWRDKRSANTRERVTMEVRLDPIHDAFEWVDHERPLFATEDTWTIELPQLDDEAFLRRRPELGQLITRGLPDDEDKPPSERRGGVDLRALNIVSRRTHWRGVRIEVMRHPGRRAQQLVGYIGDAENPPLTRQLARHVLVERRKRLVATG